MNKDEMIKSLEKDINTPFYNYSYLANKLYNANYRKIGEDEIVITKRQYEQLKKYNRDRKRLRLRWQQAKQEAAREILQELYDEAMRYTNEVVELTAFEIKQLAKEKGIELED